MKKFILIGLCLLPLSINGQTIEGSYQFSNQTATNYNGKVIFKIPSINLKYKMDVPNNRFFDVGTIRADFSFQFLDHVEYEGIKVPFSEIPSINDVRLIVEDLDADIYIGNVKFKTIRIETSLFTKIENRGGSAFKDIFDDTFDLEFSKEADVEKFKEYYRQGITLRNFTFDLKFSDSFAGADFEMEEYVKSQKFDATIKEADRLFNSGDYESALEKYKEARRIDYDSDYAKNKVTETSNLIREQVNESKYQRIIQDAENTSDLEEKKRLYNEALKLKPNDEIASSKLEELNSQESESNDNSAIDGNMSGSNIDSNPNQQSRDRVAEENAKQKAAEEEAKRQQEQEQYRKYKEEQRRRSEAIATSAAASSGTMLYYFGGIIYGTLGSIDPEVVYRGSSPYLGIEYGYSSNVHPTLFNSDYYNEFSDEYVEELDDRYSFTVNFDVKLKLGYETDLFGGYAYYAPQAGFSPIFDTFTYSYLSFGGRVFGGIEFVKLYYDFNYSDRYIYKFDYLNDDAGDATVSHNYLRNEIGLMFSFKSDEYIRNHIFIGLITDNILNGEVGSDDYSRVQDLEIDNFRLLNIDEQREQSHIGYTLQWKKDQHFNFYMNFFPEYPYNGVVEYSYNGAELTPGVLLEVGFLRSLDSWFSN